MVSIKKTFKPRYSFFLSLTLIIFITATLSGCGGGGGSKKDKFSKEGVRLETIISPDVIVLPTDGSVNFFYNPSGEMTLTGNVSGIKVGSVIVSGEDEGLARKVETIISQTPTQTIVKTSQASLTDIFQQLDLHIAETVDPSQIQVIPEPGFEDFVRGLDIQKSNTFTIINDKLVWKDIVIKGKKEDGIIAELALGFKVTVLADIRIEGFSLKYLEIAPQLDLKGSSKIMIRTKTPLFKPIETTIATLKFTPITVMAGPVPLVLTPIMPIVMKLEGELEQSIELGAEFEVKARVGIKYDQKNDLQPIAECKHAFKPINNLADLVSVKEKIKAKLTPVDLLPKLKLYGAAGVFAELKAPFVEGSFEISSNGIDTIAALNLDYGVELSAGTLFEIEVFGTEIWTREKYFPGTFQIRSPFPGFPKKWPIEGKTNITIQ